jgi:hypothetical protein
MFPLWSERTIARYRAAMVRLHVMGATQAEVEGLLDEAKRKTGTLRVNLLDRYRYSRWLLDKAMPAGEGQRPSPGSGPRKLGHRTGTIQRVSAPPAPS